MATRDKDSGRFMKAVETPRPTDSVAAGFDNCVPGGGFQRPVWMAPHGGLTMVDQQKFRNNWLRVPLRDQMSACRKVSKYNGLVRPVLDMRSASYSSGFSITKGVRAGESYDFLGLVKDIMHEKLVTSNVVALWRKGGDEVPLISILDAERCHYSSAGGIEKITLSVSADQSIKNDVKLREVYIKALGQRMYDCYCGGKSITIVSGHDEEWDFRVMVDGKRRGSFEVPKLTGVLDTIDFLELMGVGDWNLAWFRKDVIRIIKKGYKGTGSGGLQNEVNMTPEDKEGLGKGFSGLTGNANIPANHDVDPSYLTVGADNFDPKQVKSAIDRFLLWAGIEAVVMLGSFSQQNGAAPSLMRNHRTAVEAAREDVEGFLRRIFDADEFQPLVRNSAGLRFGWSVKSLYSIEEIMSLVSGTADGIASPQTRRHLLGLDDAEESRLMLISHKNKEAYTPPFEARQGLLSEGKDPAGGNQQDPNVTPPGRPKKAS